ncbi:MAG: hypothetical protein JO186_05220 [Actinobacteria bacterium]|nr:hypothetical protein [Actinomycetota bacterium]
MHARTRSSALAAFGGLAVLAASGCGSAGNGGYTLHATQSCLEKKGYDTAVLTNQSLPGSRGNLRIRVNKGIPLLNPVTANGSVLPDTWVYIVFGRDRAEAVRTESKAVRLAIQSLNARGLLATPATVRAGVQVTKNVFYYSPTGALTQAERSKIEACLR